MNFYLTTNENRRNPPVLQTLSAFRHIKAKRDGSQTVVMTPDTVDDPAFEPKTQEEAQAVLDGWIDAENADPDLDGDGNPLLDLDGNPITQRYLPLDLFVDAGMP